METASFTSSLCLSIVCDSPMHRAPSCCASPTPAIHYMPGRDIVEVLTKCRVQHFWRSDVRFVAGEREAGLPGQTPRQLAIGNAGGFPHVGCAAINNRARNNNSACFSPRTHHPSGQERRPPARRRRKTQQSARSFKVRQRRRSVMLGIAVKRPPSAKRAPRSCG
jgi:hypothetical protein